MIFKENILTRVTVQMGISGNNMYEKSPLYDLSKTGQIIFVI